MGGMKKRILVLTICGFFLISGGALFYQRGLTGEGVAPRDGGQALGIATDSLTNKLPADISFYPGATVKGFDEKMFGFQMVGESPDRESEIGQYFRQKLNELGWKNVADLKFQKAGRGSLTVTLINQAASPTVIILDYVQN